MKLQHISQLYFVIQDQDTNQLAGLLPCRQSQMRLLAQLYSLPGAPPIIPCLQSAIFPAYAPMYDFARAATNLKTLETVHPKKDDLRSRRGLPTRSYLFPIDQAVQFLAFNSKFVLMNDDNLRAFHLARRLFKRLSPRRQSMLSSPTMLLEPCRRLLASNGRKMSKAERNCIFLLDDDGRIVEQVRNYARRLGWRWTSEANWRYEGAVDPSQPLSMQSPLMSIALTFNSEAQVKELCIGDAADLVETVIHKILPIVEQIRSDAVEKLASQDLLLERFAIDQDRAVRRIRHNLEIITQ